MSKEIVYRTKVVVTETFFAPNETEAHRVAQGIALSLGESNYEIEEVGNVVWHEKEQHLKLVE